MLCLPSETPDIPVARAIDQYCHGVLTGGVVACKWVKLAVNRFLEDLACGDQRGLWFDWNEAKFTIGFYGLCQHIKGPNARQPIELEPWQQFIEANIYGWKREDGTRRFRSSYEEVARKNGKSTRLSVAALRGLIADGEEGAEVYAAATSLKQSNIVFSDAKSMAERSPAISKKVVCNKLNLSVSVTSSKFEPLSGNAEDGSNPSLAIVDELHEHKDRTIWDSLDQGQGARSQPLIRAITTAGFNREESICLEQRGYTTDVLEGVIQDDSHFGIIYALDESDDWRDEGNWIKANPNLGVSVHLDEMRRKYKKACASPSAQNTFRCKRLNEWTEQDVRWLDLAKWDRCVSDIDMENLRGQRCFAGLDLASTTDITALVLYFPDQTTALPFFWIPEEMPMRTDKKHRDAMRNWVDDGHIETTDGNETDYHYLAERIMEIAGDYQCEQIAFDPWNAAAVAQRLGEEGAEMIKFPQSIANFSEPSKKLEAMVAGGGIRVPENPVLRWMAANVSVRTDASGNIRPVKPKHTNVQKIDGMVAMIMAIGRAMVSGESIGSYYENNELEIA